MKTAAQIRRENLEALALSYGGARPLARAAGVQENYIAQIRGGHRAAGARFSRRIEEALSLPEGWLDQPRGLPAQNFRLRDADNERIAPLPLVRFAALVQLANKQEPKQGSTVGTLSAPGAGVSSFGLEVEGASMAPRFLAGDHVVIDPDVAPLPGDFVAAVVDGDTPVFAKYRLRESDDGSRAKIIELEPCNPDYPAYRFPADRVAILGTMIEHRSFRRRE